MSESDYKVLAKSWLSKLTLEQKIGQMTMAERMHVEPADVKEFSLGSVLSGGGSHPGQNAPADWVTMNDEFWQAAVEDEDSLGIPILFGVDAVHGHNNVKGATIFPHNIGLGAANDLDLISRMAEATAVEILASGLEWNFAPTLAVVQNCQWGRTYESFGDDKDRIAAIGEAYVTALQDAGVIGCVKHWVGDGGTTHGIDQGETTLSFEKLESTHIEPYYPALEAGVLTVMVSFNSWNGDKCHGHRFLITELLKEKLGFGGIVVSDWDGINYLDEEYRKAIEFGVNAGIDIFMVPERWKEFITTLLELVREGVVSEERIDDAVTRILEVKARYGLFDGPRPSARPYADDARFGSSAHRDIAREAVRKSLVLLKNEDDVLPLDPTVNILVAGKSANNLGNQCGGWTVSWQGEKNGTNIEGTTIWEGIQARCPNAVLSEDGSDADPAKHDVAVVVIGETAYAEGFGDIRTTDDLLVEMGSSINGLMNPLEPYGNTLIHARNHPEDLACIQRIRSKGIPVVTVLVSGRPLVISEEMGQSDAVVAAWLPGSEGAGVAEVLLGEEDFKGRLPLPWPAADMETETGYPVVFERDYGLSYGNHNVDSVVMMNYKTS